MCHEEIIANVREQVETDNPSVMFINAAFNDDAKMIDGHGKLSSFAKEQQMQKGRSCIVADSRHTKRQGEEKSSYGVEI